MVIRRIGVISLAKLLGVLYGAFGLIAGIFFALFFVLGGGAMMASGVEETGPAGGLMMGMGLGLAIVLPVAYGLMGFIGGLLTAWLYNVAAGFVGGVEIETE